MLRPGLSLNVSCCPSCFFGRPGFLKSRTGPASVLTCPALAMVLVVHRSNSFFCHCDALKNHYLLMESDTGSNDTDDDSLFTVVEVIVVAEAIMSWRSNRLTRSRLNWQRHVQMLLHENQFDVMYRMTLESFNNLLDLLSPNLQVNERFSPLCCGAPISPEIFLHCTVRFLAGGSYHDIRQSASISKPSFYCVVWQTIFAINNCHDLNIKLPSDVDAIKCIAEGFQRKSTGDGAMEGCIGALDGFLLRITAPSKNECGGNVTAYYSGHYCCYGLNVQALCDSDCQFLYFSVAAPGKTNDARAIKKTSLLPWIEKLPPGFFVACDCAYSISEHLIGPFAGPERFVETNDAFNFYLSQLRIRIEMAFGLLVTKWRILQAPLSIKLKNIPHLFGAIMRLHNYCISRGETLRLKSK